MSNDAQLKKVVGTVLAVEEWIIYLQEAIDQKDIPSVKQCSRELYDWAEQVKEEAAQLKETTC